MKQNPATRLRLLLSVVALISGLSLGQPTRLAAQRPDAAQLKELLLRYPAADANRDGVLTLEEAQAYAAEVRRKKKAGNADAGKQTGATKANKPAPTRADIAYGPHERNKLDLWLAKSDAPTPLVVYIHGGGFVQGSKDGAPAEVLRGCLDAGVSFMSINYRFRMHAPIQDILRDCARAIQFVRLHAKEFNIDPARIASWGGSAGAGTSLWLAFHPDLADPTSADPVLRQSSRLVAAGAMNTQASYNLLRWPELLDNRGTDWERPGEVPAFYGFKTTEALETPEAKAILDDVDMLRLVSKDDPPVFLYASQKDGPVTDRGHLLHHPGHARAVKKTCEAAGVPAIALFSAAEPRFTGVPNQALLEFLLRQVKGPAR